MPNITFEGPRIEDIAKKRELIKTVTDAAVGAYGLPKQTMVILINGRPAANISVTEMSAWDSRTTDANGVVPLLSGDKPESYFMIQHPLVGNRTIRLPERGQKTVDVRGRRTTSTLDSWILGLIKSETTYEQYDLTDEEVEAMSTGQTTREAVLSAIRAESEA